MVVYSVTDDDSWNNVDNWIKNVQMVSVLNKMICFVKCTVNMADILLQKSLKRFF